MAWPCSFNQKFPGAATIRGLFLVSWVMPGLVVGAIWSFILAGDYGVLNALLKALGIIDAPVFWKSDPDLSLYAVIIANIWLGLRLQHAAAVGRPRRASPTTSTRRPSLTAPPACNGSGPSPCRMMRSTIGAVLSLGLIATMQQFDLFPAITEGGPANTSNVAQYWAWQMSFKLL